MRHGIGLSKSWSRRHRVQHGLCRNGRFRLAMLLVCLAAAASLVIPAVSFSGRLLANSGTSNRTPTSPGVANLAGTSSRSAAATSDASANAVASCTYFISAMGSGQGDDYKTKHHTDTVPTTGSDAESVSAQTNTVYKALIKQMQAQGAKAVPTFYQLPYSAPAVTKLTDGLTFSRSNPAASIGADWNRLVNVNMIRYIAGELEGESTLYKFLNDLYNKCHTAGQQPSVVLAGYSQGAMLVHNVLNIIAADKATDLSPMIKGAVLIADPERMANSDITNFGGAAWGDYGLCHTADLLSPVTTGLGVARLSCVAPDKTTDVNSQFSSIAYQVCTTDDIVCDTSGLLAELKSVVRLPFSRRQVREEVDTLQEDLQVAKDIHTKNRYAEVPEKTAGKRIARSLVLDGSGGQPSPTPSPSTSAPTNRSWTALKAPLPADAGSGFLYSDSLSAVSCPSASYCVAVGGYTDTSKDLRGLLVTWSGGAWTATQAPLPANALPDDTSSPGNYVSGVSCASASYCLAVGSYETTDHTLEGLLLTWSGGKWTAVEAPLPDNAISQPGVSLHGVSCPSATSCVVVGQYEDVNGGRDGVLLTWSGGDWTATRAPIPDNGRSIGSNLLGVSCPSATSCVAAGTYNQEAFGDRWGELLTWSGGDWIATQAPLPANAADDSSPDNLNQAATLSGISCPSTSFCMADGVYEDKSQTGDGLLLTLSDGTWSATQAPIPEGGLYYPISGSPNAAISCPSVSYCVGSGTYLSGVSTDSVVGEGELLTWSGGAWAATQAPLPADATSTGGLTDVSCASESFCVAVGDYTDSSNNVDSLLLTSSS